MPHPLAPRAVLLAAAIVVAMAVAACGPSASSPPPSGPPSATATVIATVGPSATPADPKVVYGLVAADVARIRGLQPTADVTPVVIDAAQLTANLTADFDKTNPAAVVQNGERELVALGLLPPGTSLRSAYLDLESGQVAGYYSPEEKALFVVSRAGGIGPTQRLTYAHEFTHQLQDQHFKLSSLDIQTPDQGDRNLARLSLVEGDAVSVQTAWMGTLNSSELGQVTVDALDPAALGAFNRAPAVLQQTTFFPYTNGLQFVQGLIANGGYDAVNAAFAAPPDSTEQILHPEKYASREAPIVVKPAADLGKRLGSGWSEAARDTLGEFMLRFWLHEGGVAAGEANAAAAGWGGDRLVVLTGPSGVTALAIQTTWDTPADAAEFEVAATTAIAGLHLHGAIVQHVGSAAVSIAIGPDDATAAALGGALPG